jgi:hypothetical protein
MFGLGRLGSLGVSSPMLTPAWVLSGAAVDLDFQHGRYFSAPLASVVVSRASVGYANDSVGTWTAFGANVLRRTDNGILVEESRTNGIRNNSMQGAAAGTIGSGGAYPTNWGDQSSTPGLGTTVSIVGTGSELGVDYVDVRWNGTPSATGAVRLAFEALTQIAASNGQTWFQSAFVKIAGGSLANVGQVQFLQQYRNGTGTSLTTGSVNLVPTSSLTRYSGASQASNPSTAFIEPEFAFAVTNGQAIDVTFRIGWPQAELGAFATSPIRTTNAAATRATDVVSLSNPPVFGASFSFFAQGTSNMVVGATGINSPRPISVGADAQNDAELFMSTDGKMNDVLSIANVAQYSSVLNPASFAGVSVKAATAVSPGDQRSAVAGALGPAHSAVPGWVPSSVYLGSSFGGAPWFGFVERIALWPTARIVNASLQSITT